MKYLLLIVGALSASAAYCADSAQHTSPKVETKVLQMKVPGKVDFVSWSVQEGHCVVQIDFPAVRSGVAQPKHAKTQVWLLRADGTSISQVAKNPRGGISNAGHDTEFDLYRFPEEARREAIAIVVGIDGLLFVESLLAKAR